MKLLILLTMFATVILTGCTSIEEQNAALQGQFVGKNFDEFVLVYGEPYHDYQLNNGDTMYSWTTGEKVYNTPATTNIEYDEFFDKTIITTDPGREYIEVCNMRIVVDPNGIIKNIGILSGSNSCQVSIPKDD